MEDLRQRMQVQPQLLLENEGGLGRLFPRGAGPNGALAISDKYVFVLLEGQLYQYDLDTLALRNSVRVAGPVMEERPQRPAAVPPDPNRPWLGVSLQPVPDDLAKQHGLEPGAGAMVSEVVVDSPADKAGFKAGDVILTLDGQPATSLAEVIDLVRAMTIGKKVQIGLLRDGQKTTLGVETARMPDLGGGEAQP